MYKWRTKEKTKKKLKIIRYFDTTYQKSTYICNVLIKQLIVLQI